MRRCLLPWTLMKRWNLDRILKELDVGTAANSEDMLECKDMATFAVAGGEDTQASHAGTEDSLSVPDGSDNMASGCVQIDTSASSAYMNTGTWWLNNQVGIQILTCNSKLGCTYSLTKLGVCQHQGYSNQF